MKHKRAGSVAGETDVDKDQHDGHSSIGIGFGKNSNGGVSPIATGRANGGDVVIGGQVDYLISSIIHEEEQEETKKESHDYLEELEKT